MVLYYALLFLIGGQVAGVLGLSGVGGVASPISWDPVRDRGRDYGDPLRHGTQPNGLTGQYESVNLMKPTNNLGMLLLGIYLILTGLQLLLRIGFPAAGLVLPVLAIAAGVAILVS